MFDTMTLTKVLGGFCGALLIFLLGNWAAELLYHVGGDGHGDGHKQAYVIETESDDHGGEEEVAFDLVAALSTADPAKGSKVFGKCKACHKLNDGANGTGPHLYGVVDRAVDSVEGYGYSGALEKVADVWDAQHLYDFLENPKGFAPGTKMGFSGLKKSADRVNLIAYLETIGG